MPGWGGWAEEQAKRPTPKWQKDAEKKAAKEKAMAAKNRRDASLKHVVICEKYDKKVGGSLPIAHRLVSSLETDWFQPLNL
jgi:U3 small nucleolar RNA-associated protein 14